MKTAVLRKVGGVLIPRVEIARRLGDRMRGLIGRERLEPGAAMAIIPCNSVHTCFMRFGLDLFFLDAEGSVVKVCRNVLPWRAVCGGRRARCVIETASGWLPADAVREGDRLELAVP